MNNNSFSFATLGLSFLVCPELLQRRFYTNKPLSIEYSDYNRIGIRKNIVLNNRSVKTLSSNKYFLTFTKSMLLIINTFILLVNAVTFRREFTILFNRVAIFILLYSGIIGHGTLYVTCLDTGIGIYNGLFHSTVITHSFDLFVYIIGAIILLLTGPNLSQLIKNPTILWIVGYFCAKRPEYKGGSFTLPISSHLSSTFSLESLFQFV